MHSLVCSFHPSRVADTQEPAAVDRETAARSRSAVPLERLCSLRGIRRSGTVSAPVRGRPRSRGLLEIHEHAGEAVPVTGQRFPVIDSEGRPAVTVELVGVRVVPMKEIDDDFARAGDTVTRSEGVSEYLGHTPVVVDDTLVVAERFRVVEPDGSAGR
ncbi:ASCH domain-containing protein [Streptomyces sp. NPDC101166]|uniref:ASCH domain-containing protein n=1 Tax=Streptomyces sp. NPDC101166 TaxID=3366120 RepID=UPI00381C9A8A